MRLLRLEKKVLIITALSLGLVATIGFAAPPNAPDSVQRVNLGGDNSLTANPLASGVQDPHSPSSNTQLANGVAPTKTAQSDKTQPIPKDIPDDIPQSWLDQVQKDIAQREYHITWQDKTDLPNNKPAWQAPNRAHDFRTYFTEQGLTVVPRSGTKDWLWSLKLIAYGDELTNSEIKTDVKINRIEYQHSAKLKEWYINNAQGLEQGFTLNAPATIKQKEGQADSNPSTLKLAFQLGGSLTAELTNNKQTISLKDKNQQQRFTFGKLKVIDANNKTLKSYFELNLQTQILTLVTDARDAVYPITVDPVLSGATPFLESNQANSGVLIGSTVPTAQYGYSVASAGDVNGDSFGDVVIGAYGYDGGGNIDAGAVFVYHGSVSGLSTTASWTVIGDQSGLLLGGSVASAGDTDGDGFGDIIVGTGLAGGDFSASKKGAAFVYLGSSTGLATLSAWSATGNQSSRNFGLSVASAGDLNGDGYGDVIVGAPAYGSNLVLAGKGSVFVYLGSIAGLGVVADWSVESAQLGSGLGGSVSSAGDINGDGYSDIIVGAIGYSNGETNEGAAFVYLGSSIGIDSGQTPWRIEGSQVGAVQFGISVASAGDVNGDGYSDVVVGAGSNSKISGGVVFVFHGSSIGLKASFDWTIESNQAIAQFGQSVASAGDVNGDGYGDVIVGANSFSNGEASEGAAFVYLGSSIGLNSSEAWLVESNQADAKFGYSVASAGDVNGDGYGNVIIGAYLYDNGETDEGAVGVYDLTPPLAPFTPNGSYNITQRLVGSRTDNTTLIPACGLSDYGDSFKLQVIRDNAAAGSMLQLEWEVKANGQAFVDGGSSFGTIIDASATGSATITEVVSGLQRNTAYRWRARVLENGVAGPWLRVLNHDVQGCDVRTNTEADLALTVGAPVNVSVNEEFDAVFNISNLAGPDSARSVQVRFSAPVIGGNGLLPNLKIISSVADGGGICDIQNPPPGLFDVPSYLICNFSEIPSGVNRKVTLRLKGTMVTSYGLGARVFNDNYDPDTANDTAFRTVNIFPTLGLSVSKTVVTTAENDQTDYFTVQLTSPPDGNVLVKLSSDPGTEATVFPQAKLRFNSTNWNVPLPVTVRGVRDVTDSDATTTNYMLTLTPSADIANSIDDQQLQKTGIVTVSGQNTNVPFATITDSGLSIPKARAPGYGATITGTSATLTWDKVVHPKEMPVSLNIYLCTDSALTPDTCQTINPVVQASLMPLWITAGAGGSGLLFIGFIATRPRKRWLAVAGMLAIGFTLVSCSSGGGSDLPPSAPPAPDTMGTTVTNLIPGTTYYWRVEAFDPGNASIPRVSSQVMIFTVQ